MLNIKPAEAREYAEEVTASIDNDNRQLVEFKFQLSTAFEEKLKPAKELKARHTLQQEQLSRLRKQNNELAVTPSEQERSLLARLEGLREQRRRELNLLEEAKLELHEEKKRAQRLDERLDAIKAQREETVARMRRLARAYDDVLALSVEPAERSGFKITYTDLRRSFVLRPSAGGRDEAEIVGVAGCEAIAAEFNRRRNVGALLFRVRELLNRSS